MHLLLYTLIYIYLYVHTYMNDTLISSMTKILSTSPKRRANMGMMAPITMLASTPNYHKSGTRGQYDDSISIISNHLI